MKKVIMLYLSIVFPVYLPCLQVAKTSVNTSDSTLTQVSTINFKNSFAKSPQWNVMVIR